MSRATKRFLGFVAAAALILAIPGISQARQGQSNRTREGGPAFVQRDQCPLAPGQVCDPAVCPYAKNGNGKGNGKGKCDRKRDGSCQDQAASGQNRKGGEKDKGDTLRKRDGSCQDQAASGQNRKGGGKDKGDTLRKRDGSCLSQDVLQPTSGGQNRQGKGKKDQIRRKDGSCLS